MEAPRDYLVGYGRSGEFGPFRAATPLALSRGGRVAVRTPRGVEAGIVLREATVRHADLLRGPAAGELLRLLTREDEAQLERDAKLADWLWQRAAALAGELSLPVEVLDAEVLLDGVHATLHLVHDGECDLRPLVSTLAREAERTIQLVDLTRPQAETQGCGTGGCGSGGCGTGGCGTKKGGCGTGCGSVKPSELKDYFAGLRERMEKTRTPLL